MGDNFAISKYPDADGIIKELDHLIREPIYTIRPDKLADYVENYFNKKCVKSKALNEEAKELIPGGVQHNLAFNYPFPLVITKATRCSPIS